MPENFDPLSAFGQLGGAPTPEESMRAYQDRARQAEQMRWARLQDTRSNMLHSSMSLWMHKGDTAKAGAWMNNTDGGRMQRDAISLMYANGIMGGGSSTAMMAGIGQMVGASNMRIGMMGQLGGGTGGLLGSGVVNDMMSRQMFKQVQGSMYSPVTGMADLTKTRGFDRSEVGEIMSVMGNKRMFTGMELGSMSVNAHGGLSGQLNDQTMTKIEGMFKDTAKLLAKVKNLTNSTGIQQLAAEAEKLTGMSLSSSSGPSAMTSRLDRLTTAGNVMGVDGMSLAQNQMKWMHVLQAQGGMDANFAGAIMTRVSEDASAAVWDRRGAVVNARNGGRFARSWSDEEVISQGVSAQVRLMKENPYLAEAGFALDNNLGGEETAGALRAAMNDLGSASDDTSRAAAQTRIKAALEQHTGLQAGKLTRIYGRSGIRKGTSAETADMEAGIIGQLDQNLNGQVIRSIVKETGAGAGLTNGGGIADAFLRGFSSENQEAMIQALGRGDTESFGGIVTRDRDLLTSNGIKGSDLDTMVAQATVDPSALRKGLLKMQGVAFNHPLLANSTSVQQRQENAQRLSSNRAMANFIGGGVDEQVPVGTMESLFRGYLGDGPVTNQMVVNKMKAKAVEFSVNAERGITGGAADGKRLSEVLSTYGDFSKHMGIDAGDDGTKLMEMMKTTDGRKKYEQFLSDKNVTYYGDIAAGKVRMLKADDAKEGRGGLSVADYVREGMILENKDPMLETAEYEKRLEATRKENDRMTKNQDKKGFEEQNKKRESMTIKALSDFTEGGWVDRALKDYSAESQTVSNIAVHDKSFITKLTAQQKAIGDSKLGADEKKRQVGKIEELKDKLQGSSSDPMQQAVHFLRKISANTEKPK